MRSILVTGGLGFLGIPTVRMLQEKGYEVTILDIIDSRHIPTDVSKDVKYIKCDLVTDSIEETLGEIDCVIHLAGLTSVPESFSTPRRYEQVNVIGTINLLEACNEVGISRFILASTAAVYGFTRSEANEEKHLLQPLSPYGISKLAAEKYTQVLCERYKIQSLILRFFNIYGPNQPLSQSGIITAFMKQIRDGKNITIFGSGNRTRSFIHVRDAARALVYGCEVKKISQQIINICGEKPIRVKELAQTILEISDTNDIEIEFTEALFELIPRSHCSGKSAFNALGFKPEISIRDGLKEMWESYR